MRPYGVGKGRSLSFAIFRIGKASCKSHRLSPIDSSLCCCGRSCARAPWWHCLLSLLVRLLIVFDATPLSPASPRYCSREEIGSNDMVLKGAGAIRIACAILIGRIYSAVQRVSDEGVVGLAPRVLRGGMFLAMQISVSPTAVQICGIANE